jgi:hypothetical protein
MFPHQRSATSKSSFPASRVCEGCPDLIPGWKPDYVKLCWDCWNRYKSAARKCEECDRPIKNRKFGGPGGFVTDDAPEFVTTCVGCWKASLDD